MVGRALTQLLIKEGYNVHCLDIRADLQPYQGDIRDSNRITSVTEGCVGVVHLAAVSRVVMAERDPDIYWSTNVDGLKTLLHVSDLCRNMFQSIARKVRQKNIEGLLICSSSQQ